MYLFGKTENLSLTNLSEVLATANQRAAALQDTSIEDIISLLDSFAKEWAPGKPLYQQALAQLKIELSFSEETIAETLSIIPSLLSRPTLRARLTSELGGTDLLDQFSTVANYSAKVRAFPLGTLLHVSAGNVFLGAIDSLLMGFLTKNISILKTSSKNNFFPLFFANALLQHDSTKILSDKFCIVSWKGGKDPLEDSIKNSVNGILAWGGEEMLNHYRKGLAPNVKLFEYGPKISIQVLSKNYFAGAPFEQTAMRIVQDVITWNQNACASPQNLFFEDTINSQQLLNHLAAAFESVTTPRGNLSSDEAVEIQKEKFRAKYSALLNGGAMRTGAEYLIHFDPSPFLRPSPLNRTLILKSYSSAEDLVRQLKDFSTYLQTCGYGLAAQEKSAYLGALGKIGIKRFTPLGKMLESPTGSPHDGRYGLRELVQFIPDEEVNAVEDGYFFASGGTTGNPKYSYFTNSDFDHTAELIAKNYMGQGLKEGMVAANLFAAGQMWSSFLATNKALENCKVIQLPIGMLSDANKTLDYLETFKAEVILGIPSFLIQLANAAKNRESPFKPKLIFFAGENLNLNARKFLEDLWNPDRIGSAGYASVDAGMIGYQCAYSLPGEHHVFSDELILEIQDHEGYITHLNRSTTLRSAPLSHYPTGDRMEWVVEPCLCKSKNKKFKLLGRIDSQMNVFGCRFLLQDIERAMSEENIPTEIFQVNIEATPEDQVELVMETHQGLKIDVSKLKEKIYENSLDVKKTLSNQDFFSRFKVRLANPGEIVRNPRTGKIKPVVDRRTV